MSDLNESRALPFEFPEDADKSNVKVDFDLPALFRFKTAVQDTKEDTLGSTLFGERKRVLDELEAQGGAEIPPEELNDKYPHLGGLFDSSHTEVVAKEIARREEERRKRQAIISAGPGATAMGLAGGALAFVTDPGELALIAGLSLGSAGLGTLGLGARLARAGRLGRMATSPLGREAIIDIGAASISEFSRASLAAREEQETSSSEAAMNVFGGAVLVGGVRFGFNRVTRLLRRIGPDKANRIIEVAAEQMRNDRNIDVDRIHERAVRAGSDPNPPPFRKATPGETTLYATSRTGKMNILTNPELVVGERMGKGVYLTDNRTRANNVLARREESDGKIVEATVTTGTVLEDLDVPLSPSARKALDRFLDDHPDIIFDLKHIDIETTGNDVFDSIREQIDDEIQGLYQLSTDEVMDRLNRNMEEEGIHGYRNTRGTEEGMPTTRSNEVFVFDPDRLNGITQSDASKADLGEISQREFEEEVNASVSRTGESSYSKEGEDLLLENMDREPPEFNDVELMRMKDQSLEDVDMMIEQGFFDDAEIREVEKLKRFEEALKEFDRLGHAARICASKELS